MLISSSPNRHLLLRARYRSKAGRGADSPYCISSGFRLHLAQLGTSEQGGFIVAEPKELPSVISARNIVDAVRKVDARPVAICWDAMDLGFMHALASEGIAYIRDGQNAFLPFMGAFISDEILNAPSAAPLFTPIPASRIKLHCRAMG